MTDLKRLVDDRDLAHTTEHERKWLEGVFKRFNGYPSLEQLWQVMDEPWKALGCDPNVMDELIGAYYAHPVWLLNGLFIEQHAQSLENRRRFVDWVVDQKPQRVADYGGGFGGLARMIGEACPNAVVEVIEPHPHPVAIARAEVTANVRYRSELYGQYDILIATDVFEHVPDPLGLAVKTAGSLRIGGTYLIANCFQPVIQCHLPQTFHFRHSWDFALRAVGLEPGGSVCYGKAYTRMGELAVTAGRDIEKRSQKLWELTQYLPGRVARPLTKIFV